jgi:acyl-CoA thioester hydrolase
MSTLIEPLQGPPEGAPTVPHPAAFWAHITPDRDTASRAVDHVSNVEYVRWLDMLGQRHLADVGWSADDLLKAGAMWFVARHEIDYRLEARAGETLVAATWVRNVRRVKSWRDVMVWKPAADGWRLVCTATTLWVHVNLATRKSTRPPLDMVEALQPLGEAAPPWAQGAGRR